MHLTLTDRFNPKAGIISRINDLMTIYKIANQAHPTIVFLGDNEWEDIRNLRTSHSMDEEQGLKLLARLGLTPKRIFKDSFLWVD